MVLVCYDVSHWLGANLESAPEICVNFYDSKVNWLARKTNIKCIISWKWGYIFLHFWCGGNVDNESARDSDMKNQTEIAWILPSLYIVATNDRESWLYKKKYVNTFIIISHYER